MGLGRDGAYIPTLDGWRAVAILAVLGYHSPALQWGGPRIGFLHEHGSQGVDLFFALSGLLICTKLLEEGERNGRISLRGFYTRRLFRILPAALLYLAVVGVLGLLGVIPMPLGSWLAALFSYTNYHAIYLGDRAQSWYTAHFWTLAIEEHFYLIMPGLLWFAKRRVLIVGSMIWFFTIWQAVFHGGWPQRTDLRIDELLIPAFVAILLRSDGVVGWFRAWLKPWVAALLTAGVTVAMTRFGGALEVVKPLLKVVYPLLILSTVLHAEGWAGRVLEWAPLRWIGRVSYSVYLWQQLFLLDVRETWRLHTPWPMSGLQRLPWSLVAVVMAACVSYYVVERPMIRVGHRLAGPRRLEEVTR